MSIKPKSERKNEKPVIDLQGPKGNAYYILGVAQSLSQKFDMDFDRIEDEMKSGDYEKLIEVFDKYFGDFVDLQR